MKRIIFFNKIEYTFLSINDASVFWQVLRPNIQTVFLPNSHNIIDIGSRVFYK